MVEVVCGEDVRCDDKSISMLETRLRAVGRLLEVEEGVRFRDVVVQLVSIPSILELHLTYFQDDSPTDVITFPAFEDADSSVRSGDIAICVDVAFDQSADAGHSLTNELTFLGVHGLLHLCGWNDTTVEERERMLQKQEELIARAGEQR